ncbi:MAG TPA: hypothetical protein DD638_03380, partial [Pasteurellaceae bacterium]|nr:hypothetical protein [Pasteurellaceae bacterium]
AFILMVLGLFITQHHWFFIDIISGSDNINVPADELPQVTSAVEFFNVITVDVFTRSNTEYWLLWLFHFSVMCAPLVLYFVLSARMKLSQSGFWVSAIVIALFCICFSAPVEISFCFALLLLAYTNSSRTLFGFAIFALISTLTLYYYMLLVPLLYKSFLLLAFGMIFLVAALFLRKRGFPTVKNTDEQSDTENATGFPRVSFGMPMLTLLFVVMVLGGANYTTFKYEDVLENGEPIVLKIAPVDPRSLMQGDYMVLDYDILNDAQTYLNEHDLGGELSERRDSGENITRIYALIQNDNNGVAKLCRMELNEPTHFDGCREGVYLPVNNVNSWQFRLPSQSYFFPEGKGEYYGQAEYGEYRFKDGKVLLLRLLDKDLKPL